MALRNLAVLSDSFDDFALNYYYEAFSNASMMATSTGSDDPAGGNDDTTDDDGVMVTQAVGQRLLINLGSELCVVLMQLGNFDELNTFLSSDEFTNAIALSPTLDTIDTVRAYTSTVCFLKSALTPLPFILPHSIPSSVYHVVFKNKI